MKIRVTEKHGIRRLLYPSEAPFDLPADADVDRLSLRLPDGKPVPAYVGDDPTSDHLTRVEFAVSLGPNETVELELVDGDPTAVADAMTHERSGGGGIVNHQERFTSTIDDNGLLARVVYDGIDHMRAPLDIRLNGQRYSENNNRLLFSKASGIASSVATTSIYPAGVPAATVTSTTACKSWITVQHRTAVSGSDVIQFDLPLDVSAPLLLCDFGAGGGIYTKLDRAQTSNVTWDHGFPSWSLRNGDRVDFSGRTEPAEFQGQPWFHVVDSNRAIAVAVTQIPKCVELLTAKISADGLVSVRWTTHEADSDATFAVCYHFLNDVPAIAAATCPQSILLLPVVEVID